jgi:hypothetical protein
MGDYFLCLIEFGNDMGKRQLMLSLKHYPEFGWKDGGRPHKTTIKRVIIQARNMNAIHLEYVAQCIHSPIRLHDGVLN